MHFESWWQFLGRSKQSIALIVFSMQEIKNKDLKLANILYVLLKSLYYKKVL